MADILQFKKPESDQPHAQGWATCMQCHNKWLASEVPTGKIEIQCPKCGTAKGLFMYGHESAETTWVCKCGCHVFTIGTNGAYCWKCGTMQEF